MRIQVLWACLTPDRPDTRSTGQYEWAARPSKQTNQEGPTAKPKDCPGGNPEQSKQANSLREDKHKN